MGLSTFPSAAEGVLPVIVMNTVLSVTILKNMVRSVLQVVGADYWSESSEHEQDPDVFSQENVRERRVSTTQYKSLRHHDDTTSASSSCSSCSENLAIAVECCVCLCKFEPEEEVSELSCRHFFHKGCLDKWFHNKRSTCPLCRSVD